MDADYSIPFYTEHQGTVIVSGGTPPRKAAGCALEMLKKGITNVEFICIGANAGQQATKAMGSLRGSVRRELKLDLAFQPDRAMTMVQDKETRQEKLMQMTVWRMLIMELNHEAGHGG